jgi:hypothetical protein
MADGWCASFGDKFENTNGMILFFPVKRAFKRIMALVPLFGLVPSLGHDSCLVGSSPSFLLPLFVFSFIFPVISLLQFIYIYIYIYINFPKLNFLVVFVNLSCYIYILIKFIEKPYIFVKALEPLRKP